MIIFQNVVNIHLSFVLNFYYSPIYVKVSNQDINLIMLKNHLNYHLHLYLRQVYSFMLYEDMIFSLNLFSTIILLNYLVCNNHFQMIHHLFAFKFIFLIHQQFDFSIIFLFLLCLIHSIFHLFILFFPNLVKFILFSLSLQIVYRQYYSS